MKFLELIIEFLIKRKEKENIFNKIWSENIMQNGNTFLELQE